MKSEGQIKQKLKQVIYRHRKNHIANGMARRPDNCIYNRRVSLPQHTGNRASIGVCFCPDIDESRVCDSTMAGDRQAEECPYFSECKTAEELKDDFKQKLGLDGSIIDIGAIAKDYPDVAALMWALGISHPSDMTELSDPMDPSVLVFFGDSEGEGEGSNER